GRGARRPRGLRRARAARRRGPLHRHRPRLLLVACPPRRGTPGRGGVDRAGRERRMSHRVAPDPELTATIAARLAQLRRRIAELTDRDVRIVAVTKGHPAEVAAAAFEAGCVDLGESYAQELLAKRRELAEAGIELPVRWHFVGR